MVLNTLKKILTPSTCNYCKNVLVGLYYIDWDGNKACELHKDYKCACCYRFCDKNRVEVEPDTYICSNCQKNIITKEDVTRIIGTIRHYYEKQGLGAIPPVHLHALSHAEMKTLTRSETVEGYATMEGTKYSIYFFRNISKSIFAEVFAHELLHIWQYSHGINPPSKICEGFCNLGSFAFLKSIKGAKVANNRVKRLEANPDPIYGDGFRYMRDIYNRSGWVGAIEEVCKYKK